MSRLKVISMSIDSGMHDVLKNSSKKLGCSVSEVVRKLVEKYLPYMLVDDKVPVVLEIPTELKGEELKNWLIAKSNAIVDAFAKEDQNEQPAA